MTAFPDHAVVRLARPDDQALGEAMKQFRSWLDSNKIEPILFRSISERDWQGYEFSFSTGEEAARFGHAFAGESGPLS